MGTNSKAAHEPATIAPSVVTFPIPPTADKTLHDLVFEDWQPTSTTAKHDQQDRDDDVVASASTPAGQPDDAPEGESHLDQASAQSDTTNDAADDGAADVEPLTPVPETPPVGVAAGIPVLAGGEDLVDSTATLISYSSPKGPREVLLATVTEEAEAKLLEALAISDQHMVPIQVTEQVNGRLPLDEQLQLHELVAKAAISVNNKLKHGQQIPPHTVEYFEQAKAAAQAALDDSNATTDEKAMAAYYMGHVKEIEKRLSPAFDAPYHEGGKVPQVDAYLHAGTATVNKYVPAPLDDPAPGLLPAALRDASRIKASIDQATGVSSWDGHSRSTATGKEYLIDLGQGWSAVYRPYAANDPKKHEYSLRGQLEVHAPHGAGHGKELVGRLGHLNLVNRPLSAAEGEWTYLRNNITAQGLDAHPSVAQALANAHYMEELQREEVYHARMHEAVGLNEAQLHQLARDFQLEAAAKCLPKKVSLVRDAVAAAAGFADGKALASHPGYDPIPHQSGGWLTWSRFDVTTQPQKLAKAWTGKRLIHEVGNTGITSMFASGVLASTERRATMGVPVGAGKSEHADKLSGGATSIFLRVRSSKNISGPALVWDDPSVIVRRADYYGYNADHFGAINPHDAHHSHSLTRDPLKIATFTSSSNEVAVRNGLDLLGAEAPSRIICSSATERKKLLNLFAARGITHLAGKPVTDVVC